MSAHQKASLRPLTESKETCLRRVVRASSERHDRIQRAQALLAVAAGASFSAAARQARYRTGDTVSQLVTSFNQRGLAALDIADGRGRQPTYGPADRTRILEHLRQSPERQRDGTATWSLKLLERALRQGALQHVCANTIRTVLLEAGYSSQRTRTWCLTGTALRKRKSGTVVVFDPEGEQKNLIERAYQEAEAAGLAQWCQDEAGPYQAIPHPGASWEPEGKPACQPHEYERGGTAKLLTVFHPATGAVRAKGVISASNAVLHPWLKEQVLQILAELPPLPPGERGPLASWDTWFGTHVIVPLPPLRMLLVWDNLAGHKNWRLCQWLVQHGIMPLFTPLGGSWLNMAESVQRILERRALAGQHPKDASEVIRW